MAQSGGDLPLSEGAVSKGFWRTWMREQLIAAFSNTVPAEERVGVEAERLVDLVFDWLVAGSLARVPDERSAEVRPTLVVELEKCLSRAAAGCARSPEMMFVSQRAMDRFGREIDRACRASPLASATDLSKALLPLKALVCHALMTVSAYRAAVRLNDVEQVVFSLQGLKDRWSELIESVPTDAEAANIDRANRDLPILRYRWFHVVATAAAIVGIASILLLASAPPDPALAP